MTVSHSIVIKPEDSRCKFWAKLIRANMELTQLPSEIDGANSIQIPYARKGDEELFEGDILIDAEENHHAKQRGWTYTVITVLSDELKYFRVDNDTKKLIKDAGIAKEYLPGAGGPAGAIRICHAIRQGLLK